MLPFNLTWQYGYVNGSGGWSGDYTHKNAFSDYIYLKAGTYTISYEIATTIIAIAKYNTSKVFIERDQTIYSQNTSKNKTFTLNQDGYIRISHYDDTGSQILDNINSEKNQIEIGTTATSYVEHQEQNYPFTLEEGQRMYKDSYLSDDGIHNKMTHSTINITAIVPLSNGNIGGIISLPNKTHKTDNYLLCNKAIFNNSRETGTIYENPVNCVIVGTPTDTLETMREKYNGSIIEYELENEEIIPYNSTQQTQYNNIKANASSYDDITIISSESDELGFNMNVVAVADANKVINSLDTRLLALESEV